MTHAFKQKLATSFETIAHQYGRDFFLALTHVMQDIKDNIHNRKEKLAAMQRLVDITHKNTGISVVFEIHTSRFYDAYMYPPDIKNNPIIPNDALPFYDDNTTRKIVDSKFDINGTIDLKKGVITGIFSKVGIKIVLTTAFFEASRYTAAEIAAIYAHELGHAFTSFTMTAMMVKTNHAIRAVRQALDGTQDKTIRYEILTKHENQNGVAIPNKDKLAKDGGDIHATIFLFKAYQEKYRNEYGLDLYDRRSSEYLADQYVGRLGGAMALASGLDKLFRDGGHPSYWSFLMFTVVELAKVVFTAYTMFITPLILMMMGDPLTLGETARYDPPGARIRRIKHQAVDSLKKKSLTPELRQQIVAEIRAIEQIESQIKDRNTLYDSLYGFIFPWAARVRKDINEQKLLEELGNNDLYVSAATLKDFKA